MKFKNNLNFIQMITNCCIENKHDLTWQIYFDALILNQNIIDEMILIILKNRSLEF